MTDVLIQMGVSNACLSLAVAIAAMIVGAKARRPYLAHLLWLLVLVKLVTPPVVTIPVGVHTLAEADVPLPVEAGVPVDAQLAPTVRPTVPLKDQKPHWIAGFGAKMTAAKPWVVCIWFLGSIFILAWSVCRVVQFNHLLRKNTEPAPHRLRIAASTIARQLGLKTLPTVLTTHAHVSPMVWWVGGKVQVVIPASLLDEMDSAEWRWIVAHELAHVRRRDYLVRWLEWLACVCFWWNPVVWWAQRNLRAMEEICCDSLVLSCLNPQPRSYAESLLKAVEFLARPAIRPPAMASEMNSGGFLERRFRMIVSETQNRAKSRRLQACVLLCAAIVLPLGMAYAQGGEGARRPLAEAGAEIRKAVAEGKITAEEGRKKMQAIREAAAEKAKKATETDRAPEAAKAHLENVKKDLMAAVKAGKISEEDAKKKLAAATKAIREKMAAGRGEGNAKLAMARKHLIKMREELAAAVKAGKISEEDAKKKLAATERAIKEKMAGKPGEGDAKATAAREYLAKMRKEIEAAVKAGKISEEDAKKKLADAAKAIREKMAAQNKGTAGARGREFLAGAKKRIEAAVKSGNMTREEADAKYKEIQEGLKKRMEGAVKRGDASPDEIGKRLRQAVAEGKISEEDARARLEAMRKTAGQRGGNARVDWDAIKKRIEGAVERGDMTREEADAKYKELRERMAGGRTR